MHFLIFVSNLLKGLENLLQVHFHLKVLFWTLFFQKQNARAQLHRCAKLCFTNSILEHLHYFWQDKEVRVIMILTSSTIINKPFEPRWGIWSVGLTENSVSFPPTVDDLRNKTAITRVRERRLSKQWKQVKGKARLSGILQAKRGESFMKNRKFQSVK